MENRQPTNYASAPSVSYGQMEIGNSYARQNQPGSAVRQSEQTADQQGQQSQSFEGLKSVAVPATVMVAPIAQVMQFQTIMADINKELTLSPEALKTFEKNLLDLSTEIPATKKELGTIATTAARAGIAQPDLIPFTQDAAKMGMAFNMGEEQITNELAGLWTIFELDKTPESLSKLGDAYRHLDLETGTTGEDIFRFSNIIGNSAKNFGLSWQQTGALATTMLEKGVDLNAGAQSVKVLLTKLKSADKQDDTFKETLKTLGFNDPAALKEQITEDAQGTLSTVLQKINESGDITGNLANLVGSQFSTPLEELVKSSGGDEENPGAYKKNLERVENESNYSGKVEESYQTVSQTPEAQLQLLNNQLDRLGITVGSVILPALNNVLGLITPIIGGIADLTTQFPTATTAIVGFIAGLALLNAGANVIGLTFKTIQSDIKLLKSGFEKVGSVIGSSKTSVVEPSRSIRGSFKEEFQKAKAEKELRKTNKTSLKTVISSKSTKALDLFKTKLTQLKNITRPVIRRLKTLKLSMLLSSASNKARAAIASFGLSLKYLATNAVPATIAALRTLGIAAMANPVGLIIGGIATAGLLIYKFWQPLGAFFSGLWSGFATAMAPVFDALQPLFDIFSWIGDAIGSLLTPVQMASDELAGFASMGEAVGKVIGAAFELLLTPITATAKAIGWVGKTLRLISDEEPPEENKPQADIKAQKQAALPPKRQTAEFKTVTGQPGDDINTQHEQQQAKTTDRQFTNSVTQNESVSQTHNNVVDFPTRAKTEIPPGGSANQPSVESATWNELVSQTTTVTAQMSGTSPASQTHQKVIDIPMRPQTEIPPEGSADKQPGDVIEFADHQKQREEIARVSKTSTTHTQTAGNLALQSQPAASTAPQIINHNNYQVTIHQQPGQDARALADDLLRELERRQSLQTRGSLYDV